MDYIDVQWRHELLSEPVRLVSELDTYRMEIRKLEFFRNGSVGRAWSGGSSLGTTLSAEPIPGVKSIGMLSSKLCPSTPQNSNGYGRLGRYKVKPASDP